MFEVLEEVAPDEMLTLTDFDEEEGVAPAVTPEGGGGGGGGGLWSALPLLVPGSEKFIGEGLVGAWGYIG